MSDFSNMVQPYHERICIIYRTYCLSFYCRLLFSIQNCNSISKREAVRADPTQGLLSYGPIRIEIPNRPHSSKLLCLYHCFNDKLVKQFH